MGDKAVHYLTRTTEQRDYLLRSLGGGRGEGRGGEGRGGEGMGGEGEKQLKLYLHVHVAGKYGHVHVVVANDRGQ